MLPLRLGLVALACCLGIDQAAVIHQAADFETGQIADGVRKGDGSLVGRDTTAVQSTVYLDKNGDLLADPLAEGGQLLCTIDAVDLGADPNALHQAAQPLHLIPADQGIGDKNIIDAIVRHRLCLAELCARDAARTAGQLLQRKINALMRLDVRTHPDPVGTVQRVHLLQVFCDLLQLDDDRRRRNKIIHRTVLLFPKFRTLFHDTER